ncbi:eCIS core domain-containing protein [Azotobacter beijerinckii]|uniref:eCIS core domain-containing protein n=1 Tax=Azotobacter beijerinckii TaxID=170623 RepID=UPI002954BECE|nr:DUF4157 domain-containing protein [Azotobacter beijerinckii]MDV7213348.1 DUF4157 domain-containing protein [Azotobacter beijerinckii]
MGKHSMFARGVRVTGLVLGLCTGLLASAGGGVPAGSSELDELHRQIRALIPSAGSGNAIDETLLQAGVPVLQELIVGSRDEALRSGVRPMPPDIRRQLAGFLPERVLAAARYRVQGGEDLTLQSNLIRYGDAQAITLDYVIVFESSDDALHNPTLWAHELTHVDQYQRWGIQEFSARYLRDYQAVEREAYEAEPRYAAWAKQQKNRKPAPGGDPGDAATEHRPVPPLPDGDRSSTCGTEVTACQIDNPGPVGTPCWCYTASGAAAGSLIPDSADDAVPAAPPPEPVSACDSPSEACPSGVEAGSSCPCPLPPGDFPDTVW